MEELSEFKPENLDEEQDDSWEDLAGEFERVEKCSAPENSNKEEFEEDKENIALQKLPSFEVLSEFPKTDFLKLGENVFTQQQTTFAFRNMTTSACSLLGLKHRVNKKTKWFANIHDGHQKKTTLTINKKCSKKILKKMKGRDLISSTSGLVLFATNVITFVLGCSLGWWSRDTMPTLAVYEFHFDPSLL